MQSTLALRLFLLEVGFNLSTRESAGLRDRLLPLGVTMMSAGSSTRPGGYAHLDNDAALEQFEIEDCRARRRSWRVPPGGLRPGVEGFRPGLCGIN